MNSQMTLFALAGKCGSFGASGLSGFSSASSPSCCSNPARASRPKPPPTVFRKVRREGYMGCGGAKKRGTFMNDLTGSGARSAGVAIRHYNENGADPEGKSPFQATGLLLAGGREMCHTHAVASGILDCLRNG